MYDLLFYSWVQNRNFLDYWHFSLKDKQPFFNSVSVKSQRLNFVSFVAGKDRWVLRIRTSFHEYNGGGVTGMELFRRTGPSTCVMGWVSISSSLSTNKSPSSSSSSSSWPGLDEVDSSLPPVAVLLASLGGRP